MWPVTGVTINGSDWGWIAVPLVALGTGLFKYGSASLRWLRTMEREAGRSTEYERLSKETVAQLERTIVAKDAEIIALRAIIAQREEAPR